MKLTAYQVAANTAQQHMASLANKLTDPNRYAAGKTVKPIPFVCEAPEASQVFMTGEFNGWNEKSHPMARTQDGAWRLMVDLKHGHHLYRFVVDGKPVLDPKANGVARDAKGERVSLIAVS
jgi:1,4-alpha-glucan branching enzyme